MLRQRRQTSAGRSQADHAVPVGWRPEPAGWRAGSARSSAEEERMRFARGAIFLLRLGALRVQENRVKRPTVRSGLLGSRIPSGSSLALEPQ